MSPANLHTADPAGVPKCPPDSRLLATRSGAYLFIVLVVVLGTGIYGFRARSIFSCPASGYSADHYLAYCGAAGYGDYDYGAFWFGLEPQAIEATTRAQVVFLGTSRMQFGLSTEVTDDWFRSLSERYYLLGFAYDGNYKFQAPLLERIDARPKVYVINLDLFFEQDDTPPARVVMTESDARARYERKGMWQENHGSICASLPMICGDTEAFFRSRETGAWFVTGGQFNSEPVSYDQAVDENVVKAYGTAGREFLSGLAVGHDCQILTMVPTVNTGIGTAMAVARVLGRNFIAPEVPGLSTFDASHLDRQSAERWSEAFLAAAGPEIQKCLGRPPVN